MKLLTCGCYEMDRKVTRQAIRDYLKIDPNHNWREMKHNVKTCIKENREKVLALSGVKHEVQEKAG